MTSQRRGDLIYGTGRDVSVRNANTAALAANVEMTKAIFATAATSSSSSIAIWRSLRTVPGQSFFGYDDDVAMGQRVRTDASDDRALWNWPSSDV